VDKKMAEKNYKLLIGLLMLMLILTVLSIVSGNSFASHSAGESYSAVVNGTTSDYTIESDGFSINAYTGAIIWLVVIVAIGVGAGIAILGSGLAETSINLLFKAIFYGAVWGILSIFPLPLMWDIYLFGGVLYITLTIIYVISVIMVV
jgi:hypothetical protein